MFTLPQLKYGYGAFEPHIDSKTMDIHHTKHHKAYVDKLNDAIKDTELEGKSIEEIMQTKDLPKAVRNNGGGHYNHSLFWELLSPAGGGEPEGELLEAIEKTFGSFDAFKEQFEEAALGRFGSGWAWLVKIDKGLKITSTPNQDNPLMADAEAKGVPILGLDVWEHAYYLQYQNKRADYVKAFWNVINWQKVGELYTSER